MNRGSAKRTLCVALGASALSWPLSGCSFLIESLADPIAQRQVKRLKLPTSYAAGFSRCLQGAEGRCDVKDSLADVMASSRSAERPRLLDTTTASPKIKLIDEQGRRVVNIDTMDAGLTRADGRRISGTQLQVLQSGALAADKARAVLNSDMQKQLNQIFNIARMGGIPAPTADQPGPTSASGAVTIDVGEFGKYLDMVEEASSSEGWEALAHEGVLFDTPRDDQIRRQYIAAYFRAYFRNGKFYSVTLNGEDLKKKVVARLKDSIPGVAEVTGESGGDPYEKLAAKLFSELKFDDKTQRFVGKVAVEGFVTRGGQEVKFPAVEAELSLASGKVQANKLDYVAIGSDLIRVLLHAIYDAHDRIPGVSNATGYTLPTPLGKQDPDPAKAAVDAEELGEIEARAAKIETSVSAGVGRVVRGLGIVALNNEALATAIETAVGVAARKHTEKIMWCWTACRLNEPPAAGDASPMVPDEVAVDIAITGEPRKAIGVARTGR